jgi:hypothetical protein
MKLWQLDRFLYDEDSFVIIISVYCGYCHFVFATLYARRVNFYLLKRDCKEPYVLTDHCRRIKTHAVIAVVSRYMTTKSRAVSSLRQSATVASPEF